MLKKVLFGLVLLSLSGCIGSGAISGMNNSKEGVFPEMVGIDLMGDERKVPASFSGRLNVVAVAFQQEQQSDVDTWIAAMDEIRELSEDVRFYELPVIYEVKAPYRFWINNGMRSGIPSLEARERTITIYTDREPFFKAMDMNMDNISVLLLDDDGEILWRADGPRTDDAMQDLKDRIQSYLN